MTIFKILATIFMEFGVGLFVGLLIKEGSHENTVDEIKIATLMFIVVLFSWYFGSARAIIEIIFEVSYLWGALIFGVFLDNHIKLRFFKKIIFLLRKKDLQLAISEYQIIANQVAINYSDKTIKKMENKLDRIGKLINNLKAFKDYQTGQWIIHLDEINTICYEYSMLSKKIGEQESDRKLRDDLIQTGDELAEIVYHTLNHTEKELNTIGIITNRGGHNEKRKLDREKSQRDNGHSEGTKSE